MTIRNDTKTVEIGTADTTIYTVPTGRNTVILNATIVNQSSSDVSVTVHYLDSGNSPANDNTVAKDVFIPAQGEIPIPSLIGGGIANNASISAIADTASSVNFILAIQEQL